MTYSILIVDDEELIRQGIKARLDYLGFEFERVEEADDGISALLVLEDQKIDIVITDMKMTDLDGIEFIKAAKELYPKIEFIILSGYAEFAYAEQAIALGVNAYLLKPISNDQLRDTISSVIKKLDKKGKEKETIQLSKGILKENTYYVLEKDLNSLLNYSDPFNTKGLSLSQSIEAYLPIKNRKFMIILINIDAASYGRSKFFYQDTSVIRFSIKNVFREIKIKGDKIIVNNLFDPNQLFAIISHDNAVVLRTEVEQLLSKLQGVLWNKMGISMSVGISAVTDVLSKKGTREAQEAFSQRLIHGSGNIYFYDDIKLLCAKAMPTGELNMLRQYIERNDIGNIQFIINTIFSDERIHEYNVNYIRMIWIRIVGILLRSASSSFEQEPEKAQQLVVDLDKMLEMGSLNELREYFWMLILDCLALDDQEDIPAKDKIQLAIKYMTDHYNEDISINELAERFTMSPNYFSSLFKKETGQSAINYIKELRIERAKDYLAQSDESAVEIAKKIGYEDSQYFFKVFKKSTGKTPLQYRRAQEKL